MTLKIMTPVKIFKAKQKADLSFEIARSYQMLSAIGRQQLLEKVGTSEYTPLLLAISASAGFLTGDSDVQPGEEKAGENQQLLENDIMPLLQKLQSEMNSSGEVEAPEGDSEDGSQLLDSARAIGVSVIARWVYSSLLKPKVE